MKNKPSAKAALPPELKLRLGQLGARIRLARKRRGLGLRELAAQMLVSINTLRSVEAGDPGASMGAYAVALWALGLHASFDDLAKLDIVGLMRDKASRKRRVTKSARNDDF
jgi:transcriptional regulator with XRE-family HTH domain